MRKFVILKQKQFFLLKHLILAGNSFYNVKFHKQLSPIGWHILHCLYVECIWIRSFLFDDNLLVNRLRNSADSIKVSVNKRGKSLPSYYDLLKLCKKEFSYNTILLEKAYKNKKLKNKVIFVKNFLINHHSQHIETIKIILNLKCLKNFNKNENIFSKVKPKAFKFIPISMNKDLYQLGTNDTSFSYDNEKPIFKKFMKKFFIDSKLISIGEWLSFIFEGGYRKEEVWSSKGWKWKCANKIESPLNWKLINERLAISTPYGFKKPKYSNPVMHISYYELEAFACWQKLKIPHELQWEASSDKLMNKNKVWEWSNNLFFPYEGFTPYPYKEYSEPWFNNNHHTLRGSSIYSEKEVRRKTFRNFYEPCKRFIFCGGRLSSY